MNDKIVNISFNVWANDESEAIELKKSVCGFIDWFGERGIKVTASKLNEAVVNWQKNPFVKSHVINHYKK